jgi:NAD(P)-dependent dehydrogenase (short-subunit alcohol dehydrogenase family)
VRDLVEQVKATIGHERLDVLVNNAGGGGFFPTEETTEDLFDTAFNLNVKAPYCLAGRSVVLA